MARHPSKLELIRICDSSGAAAWLSFKTRGTLDPRKNAISFGYHLNHTRLDKREIFFSPGRGWNLDGQVGNETRFPWKPERERRNKGGEEKAT